MRIVVETPHLIIRTWQESDIDDYALLINDEDAADLTHFTTNAALCRTETELWRYLLEQDKWGWSKWAVVHKRKQLLIGYCGFSPYHHDVEISWRFFPEYRGKALAIEAIAEVINLGLNHFNFKKIISFTNLTNHHSISVMQQVGMMLDGVEGWGVCTAARYSLTATGTNLELF